MFYGGLGRGTWANHRRMFSQEHKQRTGWRVLVTAEWGAQCGWARESPGQPTRSRGKEISHTFFFSEVIMWC